MRTQVPRYLYKYRPVDANALAMLASDKLYLSRLDAFNDPFEVPNADLTLETKLCFDPHGKFATLEDPARNEASLPSLRACSLSEDCQDLLMWGHYANRHRGFCLRFEFAKDPQLLKLLFPIQYRAESSGNDGKATGTFEEARQRALEKSDKWSYE